MWVTPDGNTHTAALVDPERAMSPRFHRCMLMLREREARAAWNAVIDGYEDLFDQALDLNSLTSGLEGLPIPDGYLDGEFEDAQDLVGLLKALPIDWRFEGFEIAQDFLEDAEPPTFVQRTIDRIRGRR
jgi:hypothetical protein